MPARIVSFVVDEEQRETPVFTPFCPERFRERRFRVEQRVEGQERGFRDRMFARNVPLRRRPDVIDQIIRALDRAGNEGGLPCRPVMMHTRFDQTAAVVSLVLPAGISAVQPPDLIRPHEGVVWMQPAVLPLRLRDRVDHVGERIEHRGIMGISGKIGHPADHLADQPVVPA